MSAAHDPAPGDTRADVGVLFVHGIGEHKEGETLVAFGEPTADWLREWLDGDGAAPRGRAAITDVDLHPPGGAPAWARLEIASAPTAVDARPRARWLLSEAWWGDTVQAPPSLRLLTWLWSRGPMLIFWHIYLAAAPRDAAAATSADADTATPRDALVALSAFAVAGITQVAVTVALVLWVIPYGPWRSALTSAVRSLTATLGDSYVLLEHDMQRAALVSRVRAALKWLVPRVRRIAVVAHSQGGAIAHEAVRASCPASVELFVSVGSGLEKLAFLKLVRQRGEGLRAASLVVPLTVAGVAGVASGAVLDARALTGVGWVLLFSALCAAGALLGTFRNYRRAVTKDLPHWQLPSGVTWVDIHASHDLVPMGRGSIFEGAAFTSRLSTVNTRSILADHTAYFANKGHFQPLLWQALARMLPGLDLDPAIRSRWDLYQRVHGWNTLALELGQVAVVAAGLLLLTLHRSLVEHWGRVVDTATGSRTLWGLDAVTGAVQRLVGLVGAQPPSDDVVRSTMLGSLMVVAALALWMTIVRARWTSGCARRWQSLCRTGGAFQPPDRLFRWIGPAWTFALAALPLGVTALYSVQPQLFSPDSVGAVVRVLLATLLLLFAALVVALSPVMTSAFWEEDHASIGQTLASVVALAVLLPLAAFWLWPPLWPHWMVVATTAVALCHVTWSAYAWRHWRRRVPWPALVAASLMPLLALVLWPALWVVWCAVTLGQAFMGGTRFGFSQTA